MEPLYIIVMFVFLTLQLVTLKLGGWILPFLFGIFGLGFTAASLGVSADIPLYPYPNLLLGVTSIVVMLFATQKRNE